MRAQASGRGLHNVPAELTSFVGRRHELAELKQRLTASRLVTLTGPGGVGKTRLAVRGAATVARAFPDGVWLVTLAPIHDPPLVTQAVFHALGLQDRSGGWAVSVLTDYLAAKRLLLILDNCEHLLDSCAVLVTTLLKTCPRLSVVATSRQPLGTAGEFRLPVPPMPLPDDSPSITAADLRGSDAVELFRQRAIAVDPDFAVDASNARNVARLCRRLDGIPLALELAAVRLGASSLEELINGLSHEGSIPGSGTRGAEARQQTLDATIGWSHRLLDEPERRLWARLSVFTGGFDAEAAVEVCADHLLKAERIPDLLGMLVEKSIVRRVVGAGTTRYGLLETLRQYGRLRLRELDEEAAIQKRHLEWIRTLTRAAGAWDSRQAELFHRMYIERDNLWAALDYCRRHPEEVATAAGLAQDLLPYWSCRGPVGDVRRVLGALIDIAPPDSIVRARLLWVAASMAASQSDYETCGSLSQESHRIATQLMNVEVIAWARLYEAIERWSGGNLSEATALIESTESLSIEMNLPLLELAAVNVRCYILLSAGQLDCVADLADRGLSMSRALGELWLRGLLLNVVSQANWLRGDRERAEAQARLGVEAKRALDDRNGLTILLETLAWMAAERGEPLRAATLLGFAEHMRQISGLALVGVFRTQHERSAAVAGRAMGQEAFTDGFQRGCAMTIDLGVAFALEQQPARPSLAETSEPDARLTRREHEIADLVAEGLSNKQIATRLVVSDRTAESHVLNILNKLGFSSRTQIAAWAAPRHARVE